MRLAIPAETLATAVRAAAKVAIERSPIPALMCARLTADARGLAVAGNNLNYAVTTTVPAEVEQPGEAAPRAAALAGLAEGFAPGAAIALAIDGTMLAVCSGRARYRLPTIPTTDLPELLQVGVETGHVEIDAAGLETILRRTVFAAASETTRFYLCGVHLHSDGARLAAVASDGHRLARVAATARGALAKGGLIVPLESVKLLSRLLKGTPERVRLRQSASLLEVAGDSFALVTKLIDGTFPDYERIIPSESRHRATVARAELAAALDRLGAVVADQHERAVVALTWSDSALQLILPDHGAEEITAETDGAGRSAIQLHYLAELAAQHPGRQMRLATNGPGEAVIVTDSDDADVLVLQMPCHGTNGEEK